MTTIAQLRELKDGWDSYKAPAPSKEAIDTAEKLQIGLSHRKMEIGPFLDGGVIVTIALDNNIGEVELTIRNDGKIEAEIP